MRAEAPTRSEIRDTATEVFGRSEFLRRKGLLQRLWEWLLDRLPQLEMRPGATGGFAPLANLLLYLLLVALAVAVVVAVVVVVRSGRWRRRRAEPEPDVVDEPTRPPRAWRRDAEAAEAEGRWKDAVRYRFRELVAELAERRVVAAVAGRTCGELRQEVRLRAPEAAAGFDDACWLFEGPWYGDLPTGPEENRRLRALITEVLDAAPSREDLPSVEMSEAMVLS